MIGGLVPHTPPGVYGATCLHLCILDAEFTVWLSPSSMGFLNTNQRTFASSSSTYQLSSPHNLHILTSMSPPESIDKRIQKGVIPGCVSWLRNWLSQRHQGCYWHLLGRGHRCCWTHSLPQQTMHVCRVYPQQNVTQSKCQGRYGFVTMGKWKHYIVFKT